MKITFECDPVALDHDVKAFRSYRENNHDVEGRDRPGRCVVFACGCAELCGVTFAVWGGPDHVRVREG